MQSSGPWFLRTRGEQGERRSSAVYFFATYPPLTLSASDRAFHASPSILPCSGTVYFLPAAWRQPKSRRWQSEQVPRCVRVRGGKDKGSALNAPSTLRACRRRTACTDSSSSCRSPIWVPYLHKAAGQGELSTASGRAKISVLSAGWHGALKPIVGAATHFFVHVKSSEGCKPRGRPQFLHLLAVSICLRTNREREKRSLLTRGSGRVVPRSVGHLSPTYEYVVEYLSVITMYLGALGA